MKNLNSNQIENKSINSIQLPSLDGFATVLLNGTLGTSYKKGTVKSILSCLKSITHQYNFRIQEVLKMNPTEFANLIRMVEEDQKEKTTFHAATFNSYLLSLRKFEVYLRLFHGGQIPVITKSSFPRTTNRVTNQVIVPNIKSEKVEILVTDELSQIYISFITYRLRRVGLLTAIKDCTSMLIFCNGADVDLLDISKNALEQIEQSLLSACSAYASEKSGSVRESASTSVFAFLDYFRFLNGNLELRKDDRSALRIKYNLAARKK